MKAVRVRGENPLPAKESANSGAKLSEMSDNKKSISFTPSSTAQMADVFLTEKQLAERHLRSSKTLRNDRVRGAYIPFVKIGRHVRYRLSDVLAYEQAHAMTSTSTNEGVARRSNNGSPLE